MPRIPGKNVNCVFSSPNNSKNTTRLCFKSYRKCVQSQAYNLGNSTKKTMANSRLICMPRALNNKSMVKKWLRCTSINCGKNKCWEMRYICSVCRTQVVLLLDGPICATRVLLNQHSRYCRGSIRDLLNQHSCYCRGSIRVAFY